MDISGILAQMGGLQSMARELGISESQAKSGAEALLPAILGGFKKHTPSQPSGLAGFGGLLGQLGGGGPLGSSLGHKTGPSKAVVRPGNLGLSSILDLDGVGNPLADILGMMGRKTT
ncbi:DUF937 domain-containing protein [Candidatus Fermentibacteria bacterium]|nr:DUF937 domain-containing protein [Candidatus Fermentibacteria bacterium]